MKYCRVQIGGEVFYAELRGDRLLRLRGAPYEAAEPDGREYALSDGRLLAPAEPSTVPVSGSREWNIAVHSYVPASNSTSRVSAAILLPTGMAAEV